MVPLIPLSKIPKMPLYKKNKRVWIWMWKWYRTGGKSVKEKRSCWKGKFSKLDAALLYRFMAGREVWFGASNNTNTTLRWCKKSECQLSNFPFPTVVRSCRRVSSRAVTPVHSHPMFSTLKPFGCWPMEPVNHLTARRVRVWDS